MRIHKGSYEIVRYGTNQTVVENILFQRDETTNDVFLYLQIINTNYLVENSFNQ